MEAEKNYHAWEVEAEVEEEAELELEAERVFQQKVTFAWRMEERENLMLQKVQDQNSQLTTGVGEVEATKLY